MLAAEPTTPIDPPPLRRIRAAPLGVLAGAVALGVVVDRAADPWGTATWGALALAALGVGAALLAARRRDGRERGAAPGASLTLVVAWGALGGAWHHERWSDRPSDDLAGLIAGSGWGMGERRVAWVRGVVIDPAAFRPGTDGPTDPGSTRLVLALTAIRDDAARPTGWRPASGGVQVFVGGDRSDLIAGRAVEATGLIGLVEGPLNPGEVDFRPILRADGIELRLAVDGPSGIWDDPTAPDWPWTRRLGAVRAWSHRQLARGMDPATLPLASALLLGRREAVSPEVNDAFSRTGTTHLLAISGLHLQMLAIVLGLAGRAAGLGRRATFAVVALGTLGYAGLVGFAPSVVRSTAMTLGACAAGWRDRCATAGNLMGGAVLATIAWNPSDLFDVGCQLSFVAVAALIWLVPAVLAYDAPVLLPLDVLERQAEPWWRTRQRLGLAHLRTSLIGSGVVWLVAWPLVTLRFHLLSPVAILANLPLIPLTSLALLLAGLTLGLSTLWGPLGWPFARACGWSLDLTAAIVRRAVAVPGGHVFAPEPPPMLVGLFYLLLLGATIALASRWPGPLARPWWRATIAVGAVLALVPLAPSRPATATADVWAVGHGLSVLVRSPSGRTALYDAGRMHDPHVGRRVIAPALWASGVRRVDHLILSHADEDHYGGVPDLLDRFEVGSVRVPPGFAGPRNPGAARLVAAIRARGVVVEPIAAGDRIDLGSGLILSALHPRADDPTGTDNARSVVLEAACGGRLLLLTGDLELGGLSDLLRRPAPAAPVDALLAPHHGGRSANPVALYEWARPRLVAVSQRPPSPATRDPLAFLEGAGPIAAPLLRTGRDGAVRLSWRADRIAATAFLAPDPPLAPPAAPLRAGIGWAPAMLDLGGPALALVGLVGGAALALAVVATEWGAWTLVAPGRKPDRAPVGPTGEASLPRRPITATASDGAVLVGDWFATRDPAPSDRTIVLLHGLAEDRRAFEVRVGRLIAAGWNVAAVDARGSGQSGGKWVSFGGREADDLRLWLDALTVGQVDDLGDRAPRFAAWGRSMGAATALRAAGADPRLRALVLEAPYADLRSPVAAVLRRVRVPGALAGLVLLRARRLAGVALDRPRPLDLAPTVRAATLIVHGANDPIAPLAEARVLAALVGRDRDGASPAELIAVPGAGHADGFAVGGADLARSVVAFLDRAVPPAG